MEKGAQAERKAWPCPVTGGQAGSAATLSHFFQAQFLNGQLSQGLPIPFSPDQGHEMDTHWITQYKHPADLSRPKATFPPTVALLGILHTERKKCQLIADGNTNQMPGGLVMYSSDSSSLIITWTAQPPSPDIHGAFTWTAPHHLRLWRFFSLGTSTSFIVPTRL